MAIIHRFVSKSGAVVLIDDSMMSEFGTPENDRRIEATARQIQFIARTAAKRAAERERAVRLDSGCRSPGIDPGTE